MKSTPEETPLKHLSIDYFWEQESQSKRDTEKQIFLLNHMIQPSHFHFTESHHCMPGIANLSKSELQTVSKRRQPVVIARQAGQTKSAVKVITDNQTVKEEVPQYYICASHKVQC